MFEILSALFIWFGTTFGAGAFEDPDQTCALLNQPIVTVCVERDLSIEVYEV